MNYPKTDEIATRKPHHNLPNKRISLEINNKYSYEEYQNLIKGWFSTDMGEKWDIVSDEPWIYFFRSWSGICAYGVKLECLENGHQITEAWVTREQEVIESDWYARIGGSDLDASLAILEGQLHALQYRGTDVPIPQEYIDRVNKAFP